MILTFLELLANPLEQLLQDLARNSKAQMLHVSSLFYRFYVAPCKILFGLILMNHLPECKIILVFLNNIKQKFTITLSLSALSILGLCSFHTEIPKKNL